MMRRSILCIGAPALLSPIPAFAHIGHVSTTLGHDHVLGIAAIGAAIAVAAWGALKARGSDEAPDGGEEDPLSQEGDAETGQEA